MAATLPIWSGRNAILEAVEKNATTIVLAETGSGKSTQIPQFLVDEKPGRRVAVTEPRRVAAMTLAERVAEERKTPLGGRVGYSVRFDERSSSKTEIKYLTEGTLLAEKLGDPLLSTYDVVILDEAHERTLRTDILLGFLYELQKKRPLKVVVMSATVDAKVFSEYFDNAPVVYVKGRHYHVDLFYTQEPQTDVCLSCAKTILQIHTEKKQEASGEGDILAFLPGQEEIESVFDTLSSYNVDIKVIPLYAKLPATEQAVAFQKAPLRKVILATNIAETSVTIPGVSYVIDSGLCKEKEIFVSTGIQSLVTAKISQASALQRAGRAGRERNGICYRLYTEEDYLQLSERSTPEIQRTNLAFALLYLLASGVESIWHFRYLDRPASASMIEALENLLQLKALDGAGNITALGRRMATLPLDPPYARMVLAAYALKCTVDVVDIIAMLSQKDLIFNNHFSVRAQVKQVKQRFAHPHGDHFTLLNLFRAYCSVPKREAKAWCTDNYLSFKAFQIVMDTRTQLLQRLARIGLHVDDPNASQKASEDDVARSILAGMPHNVAVMLPDNTYRPPASSQVIHIHPSSVLHLKRARAIIYDELVFTTKTYARGCLALPISWLFE